MNKTPQQKTEEDIKLKNEILDLQAKKWNEYALHWNDDDWFDFIRQKLQSRDSYWLKRIDEGLPEEIKADCHYDDGWNACREAIKKNLLK